MKKTSFTSQTGQVRNEFRAGFQQILANCNIMTDGRGSATVGAAVITSIMSASYGPTFHIHVYIYIRTSIYIHIYIHIYVHVYCFSHIPHIDLKGWFVLLYAYLLQASTASLSPG